MDMNKHCTICCRPVAEPYRRTVKGEIVEGCVAADHDGRLEPGSASEVWHLRPDAALCREGLARMVSA